MRISEARDSFCSGDANTGNEKARKAGLVSDPSLFCPSPTGALCFGDLPLFFAVPSLGRRLPSRALPGSFAFLASSLLLRPCPLCSRRFLPSVLPASLRVRRRSTPVEAHRSRALRLTAEKNCLHSGETSASRFGCSRSLEGGKEKRESEAEEATLSCAANVSLKSWVGPFRCASVFQRSPLIA